MVDNMLVTALVTRYFHFLWPTCWILQSWTEDFSGPTMVTVTTLTTVIAVTTVTTVTLSIQSLQYLQSLLSLLSLLLILSLLSPLSLLLVLSLESLVSLFSLLSLLSLKSLLSTVFCLLVSTTLLFYFSCWLGLGIHVSSCLVIWNGQGGFMTMACLLGKGHGKNTAFIFTVMLKRFHSVFFI